MTFRQLFPPFCFGSSAVSSTQYLEETAEVLKAEDAQSNTLELLFQFRQLYRWPKRTGYMKDMLVPCKTYQTTKF